MKHALYLTTYNHPAMLRRLIASGLLKDVPRDRWDIVVFDQSDDAHAAEYAGIAAELEAIHVRNPNGGASEAKRRQIAHAFNTGREIMAQISEDFVLAPSDNAECGWLASGRNTFFADALKILEEREQLAFVNWTFARGELSDFWCFQRQAIANLTLHKVADMPHVEGDVVAFGWPYTARVRELMKLLIDARDPQHAEAMTGPDGGEWVLASKSLRKGATLLAQPVLHDRLPAQRPANRMP